MNIHYFPSTTSKYTFLSTRDGGATAREEVQARPGNVQAPTDLELCCIETFYFDTVPKANRSFTCLHLCVLRTRRATPGVTEVDGVGETPS